MSETCPIEFPAPRWLDELLVECRESGHADEAEMIFDLYFLMRQNPAEFPADRMHEIIMTTYSNANEISSEQLENASVIYLPRPQ